MKHAFLPLFPLRSLIVQGLEESDLADDLQAIGQELRLQMGNLYLQDGVWNGERILAPGFARFVSSLAPSLVADGRPVYGGFFWINGDGALKQIMLQDTLSGETSTARVDGLFIYVGHLPNTALFKGQLEMDHEGYLIVDTYLHTNVPGVFAAGEVHDKRFRQAIVSAGFGCVAALEVEKYLADLE